ncbi:hypothetical protein [Microbacterium sp. P05]|uniref:hypothetical protein n=1 Tax=Microbacterium sp. P05 TaxID=3366948 RepID=UPI0037468515
MPDAPVPPAAHVRHIVRPPGLHRLSAHGRRWADEVGDPVTDPAVLDRLDRLRIPPAWTHVWAATDPDAALQATGVDARGRTQYRYSEAAVAAASENKFHHLLQFAGALPVLREAVEADLGGGVAGQRATAVVVRLLDRGLFRVGNDRYARDNHTYGLTTLRRDQVTLVGDTAVFDFVGKEHLALHLEVEDAAATAVLRELRAQLGPPDGALFATEDPPLWRRVDSATVNSFIHTHGGVAGSAKAFRTWGATVVAAAVTAGATFPAPSSRRSADLLPYDAAARLLGNTPVVARASYVHPDAITAGRTAAVIGAVRNAAARLGSEDVRHVFPDPEVQASVLDHLSER